MNPNSSLSADELRHVSGSLKRAHMSDHLATAVFYVVSYCFSLPSRCMWSGAVSKPSVRRSSLLKQMGLEISFLTPSILFSSLL